VRKRVIFLLLLLLAVLFLLAYPILFQEGNPLSIAKGVIELSFYDKDIAKVSTKPLRYISKYSEGNASVIELMDKEGWTFVEQFGSGYLFSKGENNKILSSVQYTKKYRIWEIPSLN